MRIEEKVSILSWSLDKLMRIDYYFQVALQKQPAFIFFIIFIVFALYLGIKKLFFKNRKEKTSEINYKKLILIFLFINLIYLIWMYSIVWK